MSKNVNNLNCGFDGKKINQLKELKMEKNFTITASYGVSCTTVSDWHRNKTKIQKFFTKSASNSADRIHEDHLNSKNK